jgi:hypothetical protein
MKNKDLAEKLKAIQQLKSEKYIGTKDAFTYLKRVEALDNNINQIVQNINNGQDNVKANPETLVGFCNYLDSILDSIFIANSSGKIMSEMKEWDFITEFEKIPFKGFRDKISNSLENDKIKEISDYFIDMFDSYEPDNFHPNENGALAGYLIEEVLEKSDFDDNIKNLIYIHSAFKSKWDYIFSKENLSNIEKKIERSIYSNEIRVVDRLDTMKKDMVENKIENRRELLCDWIYKISGGDVDNFDYNDLKEIISTYEETRAKTCEELIDKNAPSFLIENHKKLISEANYLNKALEIDENFVRRYLIN